MDDLKQKDIEDAIEIISSKKDGKDFIINGKWMIPIDKVKEIALKAWIEGYVEGWEDADIPDIFRVWFNEIEKEL